MKTLFLDTPHTLPSGEIANLDSTAEAVNVHVQAIGLSEMDARDYESTGQGDDGPRLLGREVSGLVVGGEHNGLRVVVNPLISCGECAMCSTGRTNLCPDRHYLPAKSLSGGSSEVISVPGSCLLQIPNAISFVTACLIEPLARGWHVARMSRRAFPRGRNALVIGDNAIGFGTKEALHAQGIEAVTRVTDADDLSSVFDIVIDVTRTSASRALASRSVTPGGVIGYVGLAEGAEGLDLNRLAEDEVTLMCTCGYTGLDFHQTAIAVFEGRLGALDWIDVRPFSEGTEMFNEILSGRSPAPRVILTPDAE